MTRNGFIGLCLLIILVSPGAAWAQGVAVNTDGAAPNNNAMLDIASPATGDGQGVLLPRVTEAQRTTADTALDGGLLDNAGDLRGGAAQGLLVYQTDGTQGFYYNASATAAPDWIFLGAVAGSGLTGGSGAPLAVDWSSPGVIGATTPATGTFSDLSATGTVSVAGGNLQIGGTAVTASAAELNMLDNVPYALPTANGTSGQVLTTDGSGTASWGSISTPIAGTTVAVGDGADAGSNGTAVGNAANGNSSGSALGYNALADSNGVAVGYQANASSYGTAIGYQANGYDNNAAIGYRANSNAGTGAYSGNVAIGYTANGYPGNADYRGSVAIGYQANARANTDDNCLDVSCNDYVSGGSSWWNEHSLDATAIGGRANAFVNGTAVGHSTFAYNEGTAIGTQATGSDQGASLGFASNAIDYGTAIGYRANSGGYNNYSVAKGAWSQCTRNNEEWKSSDGQANKYGYGQVNWHGSTTTNTATEIYLGGVSGEKFELQNNSAVTFTILVTAINTVIGDSAGWRITGTVKQRADAASTAIVGTVSVDNTMTEGGLTTAPIVDVNTVEGYLRLRVTGVNANTVRWNAAMSYSELRE